MSALQNPNSLDLTVVVTTHAEDFLLRPTLRSIRRALRLVRMSGRSAEVLFVADNATERVMTELTEWVERMAAPSRVVQVSYGEPGASRNEGVRRARGAYVALCDGDDLFTENALVDALILLEKSGPKAVAHPSHVVSFGARSLIWSIRSSDDPTLDYRDLVTANLWPSFSVTPRELLLEVPYPELPPGSGYGPEDYCWNIQTASRGVRHLTIPNAFHFYRTRHSGGVNNANAHAVLPRFDLTALRENFPRVPLDPAEQDGARTRVKRWARQALTLAYHTAKPIARRVPFNLRRRIYRIARRKAGSPMWSEVHLTSSLDALRRVAELEPALSWTLLRLERDEVEFWAPPRDGYAELLESLWNDLKIHSRVMVLAPWLGVGGADIVTANYARDLSERPELAGEASLLTTADPLKTVADLIPPSVHHTQMPDEWFQLSPSRQRQLLAQLITLVDPSVIVSVNCFDFVHSLGTYAPSIEDERDVYLSLFAFDRIGSGRYPTNPITDDAQRAFIAGIAGIITDNSVSAKIVTDTLGVPADLVKVHRQPALLAVPELELIKVTAAGYRDASFDHAHPFEVVWPHRMDREKRVDSLVRIARRVRELNLPIRFHLHGSAVLHQRDRDPRPELKGLGVVLHGAYSGGLSALPVDSYHCMLLTSESEGLPLSIVQAMLLGLPVVSSAVGGVPDIVEDGVTGLLVDGPDDIDGFVGAMRRLMDSTTFRRALLETAHRRARELHSYEAFSRTVDLEFGERLSLN